MRFLRAIGVILVLLLLLPAVGSWIVESAAVPPPPVDSGSGHWVSLLGGILVLSPFVGLYLAIRGFFRWHSRFHRRMREDGLW